MFQVSFRNKLFLTFGLLLALAVAMAGLSIWGIGETQRLVEQSRLAHGVLDGHLRLAEYGQRLLKLASVPAAPQAIGEAREALVRAGIDRQTKRIRALITAEVALKGGANDEADELDRLAEIEARLAATVRAHEAVREMILAGRQGEALVELGYLDNGGAGSVWRRLIAEAIDEEAREVAATDAAAARIARVLQLVLIIGTLAAAVLAAGAMAILRRDLDRPLARLMAGTRALAAGDLSHRINLAGGGELPRLARSFDRMAREIETQQAALAAVRGGLELQVAERTGELRAANQLLSAHDSNRRRLLADISHELRTPLTIVHGEAEVALRGGAKPLDHYQDALTRILEQARHMSRLVDDLLFTARQEAGEVRLLRRRADLGELVAHACLDMDVLARERGGRVKPSLCAGQVTSVCDPDRVRQLLFIIIDNALRYSEQAPDVAVALAAGPDGAIITVSDKGLGIPESDLPFVFERFQRGANAAQHDGNGSGLGLFMAHAIVAAHGGSIGIDSREGDGTRVTISLPNSVALRLAS